MSVSFDWTGDLAKKIVKGGGADGLRRAAEEVKAESNAAAPTESGTLVASSGTDVDEQALAASIYYDPQSPPKRGRRVYAIVRHEATRQGGAPKYLEKPVLRYRQRLATSIAASLGRVLG